MTNTVAQAETYGRTHPNRDGGSWSGWCASHTWRSLGSADAPSDGSARGAGNRSKIESTDSTIAPRGAIHFWNGPTNDGHVGIDLDGRGTRVMMASGHVTESWGRSVGTCSIAHYNNAVAGEGYRGWARDYIGTRLADVGEPAPSTSNGIGGLPSAEMQARIQRGLTAMGRYDGPADGVWGPATWRGLQITAQRAGYAGAVDGVPGPQTIAALQRYAKRGGYAGPVDSAAGPLTWLGVANSLES